MVSEGNVLCVSVDGCVCGYAQSASMLQGAFWPEQGQVILLIRPGQ